MVGGRYLAPEPAKRGGMSGSNQSSNSPRNQRTGNGGMSPRNGMGGGGMFAGQGSGSAQNRGGSLTGGFDKSQLGKASKEYQS